MTARSIVPAAVVDDGLLGGLRLPASATGVLLGCDAGGEPVLVRLFGPAPGSATFVGGWWAAQVLVHRCLAIGAQIVVDAIDTDAPARHGALASLRQWLSLNDLVGERRVRPAGSGPMWSGGPVLAVRDRGPAAADPAPRPGPGQTTLSVLSRVAPDSQETISRSDLVLAQRLDPREAALVGSALLLPSDFPARIGAVTAEMVAVCRPRAVDYVWLTPTTVERRAFG